MTVPDPHRSHHDMGGLPAATVVPAEHDFAIWEKRVDAMLVLLSNLEEPLISTDELRRNIESLGSEAYDRMSYYERWIFAISQNLIQRGVITVDELGRKIEQVSARDVSHD
jgi:Nitrile hydratase beta subunit